MNSISPYAKLGVIASEDQLFPDHDGFDFKSIEKAMKHNQKSKSLHGASTISQQVAKNVFLWQGRSWLRKVLEVYFTFMIETVWGKKRILQMYLNISEMGKGVFGIDAAAQFYFNKHAKNLNRKRGCHDRGLFAQSQIIYHQTTLRTCCSTLSLDPGANASPAGRSGCDKAVAIIVNCQ